MRKALQPKNKKSTKLANIDTLKKYVDNEITNSNFCVSIDWLSIYCSDNEHLLNRKWNEYETLNIGDLIVQYNKEKRSGSDFENLLEIFYNNEAVANILVNPFRESWQKKRIIKIEFKNHTFYSGECWHVYDTIINNTKIEYRNTARLDIAVDGVNYLHKILNNYTKQEQKKQYMKLKNSGTSRARFNAKVMNPQNLLFENFSIGGHRSRKMITVYNKTIELLKSKKKYIFDYWAKNKLIEKIPENLDKLSEKVMKNDKKGLDTFNVPNINNIYRFEIRLKSEAIQDVEDFDIEKLRNVQYLVSLVKLHCKNFFEIYLLNAFKLNDCELMQLLPFDKLGFEVLEKSTRKESSEVYKVKMSLHKTIKAIYQNKIKDEIVQEYVNTIIYDTKEYELREWLLNKLDEWNGKFKAFIKKDKKEDVYFVIEEIRTQAQNLTSNEDYSLYRRVQNAPATARFGEGKPLLETI